MDASVNCCHSGVLDKSGACCAGVEKGVVPVLDAWGQCCASGTVDACGICGGASEFVDMAVSGEACAGVTYPNM